MKLNEIQYTNIKKNIGMVFLNRVIDQRFISLSIRCNYTKDNKNTKTTMEGKRKRVTQSNQQYKRGSRLS
jgi:hypothetical protein